VGIYRYISLSHAMLVGAATVHVEIDFIAFLSNKVLCSTIVKNIITNINFLCS
jgi:hypothetical protein